MSTATVKKSFCRICIANCGILVTVEENRVTELKGDPNHPISHGYTCPKGRALADSHHGARRMDGAVVRRDGELTVTSVRDAITDLGPRLRDIVAQHGAGSIGFFMGSGGFVDPAGGWAARKLSAAVGTKHFYSTGTVDSVAKTLVTALMAGTTALIPHPDELGTLMVLVGSNPVVSHGQSTGFANPVERIRAVQARGKVIVIDPRASESARLADTHLATRAGADHVVLAHVVRELLASDVDLDRLRARAVGIDELIVATAPFDVQHAASLSGLSADELTALVDAIREAGRVAVVTGTGTTMSPAGNLVEWMAWAIMIITESFDRPGGMWFNPGYLGRIDGRDRLPRTKVDEIGPPSRPDTIRLLGEWPAALITDEIEAGRLKALVVVGANPITALPDTVRVEAALRALDVLVVIDVDHTESTALATHAIGCADQLERPDVLALEMFANQLYNQYTPAMVEAPEGRPPMWHTLALIGRELSLEVLGAGVDPDATTSDDILRHVARRGDLDGLRAAGQAVVEAPAFYEWVESRLPDGHWDLAPRQLVEQLVSWQPRQLVLTPRRQVRHQNSQPYRAGDKAEALMHPIEAARYGVTDGATITVRSASGALTLPVRVTDAVVKGAVSIPHGWGATNVNLLTSTVDIDPMSGMPYLSGTEIDIVVHTAVTPLVSAPT
jgi:anaerobic selenocysteine-containing dehydrogenase